MDVLEYKYMQILFIMQQFVSTEQSDRIRGIPQVVIIHGNITGMFNYCISLMNVGLYGPPYQGKSSCLPKKNI